MDTSTHHSVASTPPRTRRRVTDALALLKADHRQVKAWFKEFARVPTASQQQSLADRICTALTVHTEIEEELFYPAFLLATQDRPLHHEAIVEHAAARELIAQIRAMKADDDYFDAKVHVLSEMIKHHVKEEERPGGLFALARKSTMDLEALGHTMTARKHELLTQVHDNQGVRP